VKSLCPDPSSALSGGGSGFFVLGDDESAADRRDMANPMSADRAVAALGAQVRDRS